MNSLLEALAENRLCVTLETEQAAKEYRESAAKLNTCIEAWIEKAGEKSRPSFDRLREILSEQHEKIGSDTFLYGFRFGCLTTIEASLYQNKCLHSTNGTVLESLAENQIHTCNPMRLDDERSQTLENAYEETMKTICDATREKSVIADLDAKLYDINTEMLKIKRNSRFISGYSLGMSLIAEVFQTRDKLS